MPGSKDGEEDESRSKLDYLLEAVFELASLLS